MLSLTKSPLRETALDATRAQIRRLRRRAASPRPTRAPTDGGASCVLDGDKVAIDRVVGGVFMRVTVPTSAYRGVALRVVDARDDGFAYEIRLVHADPDLSVALAETSDDSDIQAEWRLWARVLGLPALVERAEGCDEPDQPLLGRVADQAVGAAPARQDDPRPPPALPRPPQARPAGAVREGREASKSCSAAPTPSAEATVPAFRGYAFTATPARRLWLSPADRPISGRCAPTSSRR